jgi:putative transposase
MMDGKNRRHASAFAVRVSIRPLAPQRTSGGCQCDRASDGAWTAQQIVEAFADREAAYYLIRDRDSRYSAEVRLRIQSLGMQEILTALRSQWQNPYAERLIGSIRRECLNHYIILNARHLKRTLSSYFRYYHQSRTHLSLDKQCPFPREALKFGKIIAIPQLGGLHH